MISGGTCAPQRLYAHLSSREDVIGFPEIDLPGRPAPLVLPWPTPGSPNGTIAFDTPEAWKAFIDGLGLNLLIPDVVRLKYERARKLYFYGWIDADLIKAGELVALTALELALNDRYGAEAPPLGNGRRKPASTVDLTASPRRRPFKALLDHMVTGDGLTDEQMPLVARCGGSVVGQLTGAVKPSLADRRNALAHGDPFDGLPIAGLLELVRDLIMFAYRRYLAEMRN